MNTSSLIQKVWNFCHTLRDDGVGYGDYLEQLTYLLFLKSAHEYAQEPYNRDTDIPSTRRLREQPQPVLHEAYSLRGTGSTLERKCGLKESTSVGFQFLTFAGTS